MLNQGKMTTLNKGILPYLHDCKHVVGSLGSLKTATTKDITCNRKKLQSI